LSALSQSLTLICSDRPNAHPPQPLRFIDSSDQPMMLPLSTFECLAHTKDEVGAPSSAINK